MPPGSFDGISLDPNAPQPVAELSFLAEVAHLVATARTWEELMDTVIERTKAAARADVCSLYLTDRDGSGLTLAATNGLDQHAVGVARLEMGTGITGIAAESRLTITSPDVNSDERFAWIRGVDQARFTSMCSVPLVWDEEVIGVLNVQTVEPQEFTSGRIGFLEALAGLLAGMVEKSRLHAEAEAQIDSLRAIDEARASLIAVVTHSLRTPLAVVRAYVELLGAEVQSARQPDSANWEREALAQVDRIDETVDSILDSLRVLPSQPAELAPLDLGIAIADIATELRPMFRRHTFATHFRDEPLVAMASFELLRRLLGYLLENASKYAPETGTIDIYGWREHENTYVAVTDDGPGIPEPWRESIFEPFVRLADSARGAGIGLFAARHMARSMGGELTVEPR
jgi:two-component system, OmpR family, sensor histidine kinase KdpD